MNKLYVFLTLAAFFSFSNNKAMQKYKAIKPTEWHNNVGKYSNKKKCFETIFYEKISNDGFTKRYGKEKFGNHDIYKSEFVFGSSVFRNTIESEESIKENYFSLERKFEQNN